MDGDTHDKINELVSELQSCRDDERDVKNQILQVILITGTILGILFGASYLGIKSETANQTLLNTHAGGYWFEKTVVPIIRNITPARLVFWLSALIFSVAYLYIINLGIENILRYYYIQNIEDRLQALFPDTVDNEKRGKFLHWNGYIAPVVTKNSKHISSTHTLLHFVSYTAAIAGVVAFSIGMVVSTCLIIDPIRWFDILLLVFMVGFMTITFLMFLRSTIRGEEMQQFAWDTAHMNQEIRLGLSKERLYKRAKPFRRLLLYFLYPRISDIQKILLIVIGFIYGVAYFGTMINIEHVLLLFYTILIFDVCACQARFQINDIRGRDEDLEIHKKHRLLGDGIDERYAIKLSSKIAFIKIALAVLLVSVYSRPVRDAYCFSLVVLLIITVSYEAARCKKCDIWVFFLVGAGYPLRFFVGLIPLWPVSAGFPEIVSIVCFMAALWFYGSCSSILSWVNEITAHIQEKWKEKEDQKLSDITFRKSHYNFLRDKIEDHYMFARQNQMDKTVLPLMEKGELRDPWNLTYILSVGFLTGSTLFMGLSYKYILMEIACLISFFAEIYLKRKGKWIAFLTGIVIVILKLVWHPYRTSIPVGYRLVSITQILITATYTFLLYQLQFKLPLKDIIRKAYKGCCRVVLGKDAADKLWPPS